jgi:hypothetical protein
VELLKTGVMSAEDVEAIRRLKESNNVVMKRGSKIDAESLETLKEVQKKKQFGTFHRKGRADRVSPTSSIEGTYA